MTVEDDSSIYQKHNRLSSYRAAKFPLSGVQSNAMAQASFHEDFSRGYQGGRSSERAFGLQFGVLLTVIALWPGLAGRHPRWWALAAGALLLLVSLARPSLLALPNAAWNQLSLLLGRVVNPLVTGLLFFTVFVPTALISRLWGRDALRMRFDPQADTYWISRQPPGPAGDTMPRQF